MRVIALLVSIIVSFLYIAGCGDRYTIVEDIPAAENSCFTTDGRFFVTGGKNVYEVVKDENEYKRLPLFEDQLIFTGITEYNGFLFVIGMKAPSNESPIQNIWDTIQSSDTFMHFARGMVVESLLFRADLSESQLVFEAIYTFQNMFIPNGMVADQTGHLYIADSTFLPNGQIVQLTLTENNPPEVTLREQWLSSEDGAISPNGMAIRDETIYFSDLDLRSPAKAMVKKVAIQADGSPGDIISLYARSAPLSVFDDLSASQINGKDGVLVTDFIRGTIFFIEDRVHQGEKVEYEYPYFSFQNPTSVILGKSPLFDEDEILVTLRGNSDAGNQVSAVLLENFIMK